MRAKKKRIRSSGVPRVPDEELPDASMKTWHAFAFLIVTAVALYYLKGPILVVAAIVFLTMGAAWCGRRFPLTTIFIVGFIRGLMGRRW